MSDDVASDRQARMNEITAGLKTKSDKIRTLAAEGYKRSEIAKYLGIRYQHVRNVLVSAAQSLPNVAFVRIGPGGRIVIPAPYRQGLGLKEGDAMSVRLDDDELRLASVQAGVRRAQRIVRRHVPKETSLANELIEQRRSEANREDGVDG